MTIIAFVSICYIGISENFSFSFTKNWFIIVWQKENNFPISRRRKMVHCRSLSSFVRKRTIYFSAELWWRKKAPFLWHIHHSYMWNYTHWKCAMQYWGMTLSKILTCNWIYNLFVWTKKLATIISYRQFNQDLMQLQALIHFCI